MIIDYRTPLTDQLTVTYFEENKNNTKGVKINKKSKNNSHNSKEK